MIIPSITRRIGVRIFPIRSMMPVGFTESSHVIKKKTTEQHRKLGKKLASRKQRDKTTIDKLKLRIETKKVTRDYNLATSLKSYIDPRIYYEWGRQVDYDWKKYYSKTLQKKFSWVELEGDTTNRQS